METPIPPALAQVARTAPVMSKDQLAVELKRLASVQVADITRAVKEGQKAIALNEVRDLAQRLARLADAFAPPAAEPGRDAA